MTSVTKKNASFLFSRVFTELRSRKAVLPQPDSHPRRAQHCCGLRLPERRLVASRSTVIIPFDDRVVFVSLLNCAQFPKGQFLCPMPNRTRPSNCDTVRKLLFPSSAAPTGRRFLAKTEVRHVRAGTAVAQLLSGSIREPKCVLLGASAQERNEYETRLCLG